MRRGGAVRGLCFAESGAQFCGQGAGMLLHPGMFAAVVPPL